VCVAVRRHPEEEWHTDHPAVGQRLLGALLFGARFAYSRLPKIGMRLVFENDLMTSPLVEIRPD
jgi:hypothetical protein